MPDLVVGLGNPGSRYRLTWHNAGFWVADILASSEEALGFTDAGAFLATTHGAGFHLIKPNTFMNNSGGAVSAFVAHLDCSPGDILVVCDDVSLPLGSLRLRRSGSHGGHNGLRSIIEALGTSGFPRLRLGIGPVPDGAETRDFVLGKVPRSLREEASRMANRAADCVLLYASEGLAAAQNRYNSVVPGISGEGERGGDDTGGP